MAIRQNFPEEGSDYMGGQSDGWEYRTSFGGSTLEDSYHMLRQFLREEGYADVPIPADTEELLRFKHPRKQRQIQLFEDYGYVHNPIKIFFPEGKRKASTLILCIYNELATNHLLRFHGLTED